MPRDKSEGVSEVQTAQKDAPVLLIGLGRGKGGKSTGLAEIVWRAQRAGRDILVADGDPHSRTLSGLFPGALRPDTGELPDMKAWLTGVLNAMAREKKSAVVDVGAGDRVLLEYGRDMRLVEFCRRRGIQPVAAYFLGDEKEDLNHVEEIWRGGYFKPDRTIVVLNEGVIGAGKTTEGAFEEILSTRTLDDLSKAGAKTIFMQRLAWMKAAKGVPGGFYEAAFGNALDPVQAFAVEDWLQDLEQKRVGAGVAEWLP